MASPTLADFFGSNAQYLESGTIGTQTATSGDPILAIKFSDFTADQSFNTPSNDAEKWATALIRAWRDFTAANTDEVPNVVVDEPRLGLTSRDNANKREYSYSVQIYTPDTGSASPDPDEV